MQKVLSIRIQDKTLEQADRLREKFDAPSRSDVIRRAIELSEALTQAIQKGDKIYIEGHGDKREVILPGLTHGK